MSKRPTSRFNDDRKKEGKKMIICPKCKSRQIYPMAKAYGQRTSTICQCFNMSCVIDRFYGMID